MNHENEINSILGNATRVPEVDLDFGAAPVANKPAPIRIDAVADGVGSATPATTPIRGCVGCFAKTVEGRASYDDLVRADLRVGQVIFAESHKKARLPMYRVDIDFGPGKGVLRTCAQITGLYKPEELVGKYVMAATNVGLRNIAGTQSECLIMAAETADGSALLVPEFATEKGAKVR